MKTSAAAHPDNSPDEMVEEIDITGNVLRLVPRRKMRAEQLCHRSVFIAVMSEKGDLLVHKRAETKDIWPGWWDVAVGGVVGPGETWADAAVRELHEELGIEGTRLTLLGIGAYRDPDVQLVAATFLCRTEGPFAFADGEITEAHWVSQTEIPVW
ncbi:MAG: NUDIX domain-containing protein, partial [Actinomycetota bacterium]